jgi:hypothetical protein
MSSACGKGRMGIIIKASDQLDTTELTRIHVRVREQAGGKWEANIDRGGGHWNGSFPVKTIYSGYVPDADKYSLWVEGYAGDQVVAQNKGVAWVNAWFSNVERAVEVTLYPDAYASP